MKKTPKYKTEINAKFQILQKHTKFHNSDISDVTASARITGKATDMKIRLM